MTGWIDTSTVRDSRVRRADVSIPEGLSIDLQQHRALLTQWVRKERQEAARATLLRESKGASIESVEAACDLLLREGWVERRERLRGGSWQWQAVIWRDLEKLQSVLGVTSRSQRESERRAALDDAQSWLSGRASGTDDAALDPDLLDEMTRVLKQLATDVSLPVELLRTRLGLLRALAHWHDSGAQGPRREFALRASGTTKGLGGADWRWLEASFDLERVGIETFAPQLWLAGDISIEWPESRIDLRAVHFIGLPLQDVARAERLKTVSRFWMIENRASFERQARDVPPGVLLVWMPGRPSTAWTEVVAHLLNVAPAPAWISADADPSGVDITCHVGALWTDHRCQWQPHQMSVANLQNTTQRWPLNEHDRVLIERLLSRKDLQQDLRELCEVMRREGRKAEQEAWL